MNTTYDRIGSSYGVTRCTDPRIAARINAALADAGTVVNVGAGTGSYEPNDRLVVAVEPSQVMIAQRPGGSAPCVQAVAEALPFADRRFEAAMAVLAVHHWADPTLGVTELRRVAAKRVVILTNDDSVWATFWLVGVYFPAILELDRGRFGRVADILSVLGNAAVIPVAIPADCVDGFTGAFWRRPEVYLDPRIRAGQSSFALIESDAREAGLRRLSYDLASGTWHERFGHLLQLDELDLGYRLVVAELT